MSSLIEFNLIPVKADDFLVFFRRVEEKYTVFIVKDEKSFKVICYETFFDIYNKYLQKEEIKLFPLLKNFNLLEEI